MAIWLAWPGWHGIAAAQGWLRHVAAAHPLLAPVGFALTYAAVVALSIPNAALLSVAGGAVFGPGLALACVVPGATLGAVALFLAARAALGGSSALGARWRRRALPLTERIRPGLERDGFSYLLALRLLPVVPFWLLNLAPALVGMRLVPFAAATAIGIIPGALLFVTFGASLGDLAAAGAAPDLAAVFTPRVLAERGGLALLALVPVGWRYWRRRHG